LIHPIEPRPERIGPAGNTSPYQVYGQTYHIMPSASGYREEGVASWYGTKFHGELTSNGERYDLYALSAAHKTLPIPSYVRVTNLNNGRQIVVRVNDRGPFHGDRIIDLSYAAALKLGYQQHGTARVSLEAITFDAETQGRNHYLQVGAFSLLGSAQGRQAHIESFTDYPVDILLGDDGVHRVQIGPLLWSELATLKSDLTQQDISVSVVSR
jgi:rare lipoprotein A